MTRTLMIVLVASIAIIAHAQTPPAFEVASIKPNTACVLVLSGITALANGRLSGKAMTGKALGAAAYRVQEREILGRSGWIETGRFDIEARAGTDVDEVQLRLMLRELLAE